MEEFLDRFARIPILHKILGLIVILILIYVANIFLFLAPIEEEQASVKNKIANLESDLEKKRKVIAELSIYKRRKEKLEQELSRAIKLLPEKSEIDGLLQRLSALARKAGLFITSFVPKPEKTSGFYSTIPIKLDLEGTYVELVSFFDSVQKLNRIVSVGDFNFNLVKAKSKGKITGKKILSAKVTVTTYRFLPGKLN